MQARHSCARRPKLDANTSQVCRLQHTFSAHVLPSDAVIFVQPWWTLIVPRTRTWFGDQCFDSAAPWLWNSLPRSADIDFELGEFKCLVKIYLFGLLGMWIQPHLFIASAPSLVEGPRMHQVPSGHTCTCVSPATFTGLHNACICQGDTGRTRTYLGQVSPVPTVGFCAFAVAWKAVPGSIVIGCFQEKS